MLSTIPPEDRLGDEAQKKGGQEMELPDVENCPICMSPVTGNEDEASLDSCEHIFHFDCITKVGLGRSMPWEHDEKTRLWKCTQPSSRLRNSPDMFRALHLEKRNGIERDLRYPIAIEATWREV